MRESGAIVIHSPCPFDDPLGAEILSHGDLVTRDAERVVRDAWGAVLGTSEQQR